MIGGSYGERIDYTIRPAKNIQRKMLCEALRRLSHFGPIESYRYIGFGALYFSDFRLFHRDLGIKNMISIEGRTQDRDRYEFNRPFGCIKIMFGRSGYVLHEIELDAEKTILWLDYTCKLRADVLDDIAYFCTEAQPGSVLIVTVNADPEGGTTDQQLDALTKRVGKEKVPPDLNRRDMAKNRQPETHRRIIANHIHDILTQRNGGLEDEDKIEYRQLFNFHYKDTARMLTVGGLFYRNGQEGIVRDCCFDMLPFVASGDVPYRIEVPNLTFREVRSLDRHLPNPDWEDSSIPNIPRQIIEEYEKVYRYFPRFVETEI